MLISLEKDILTEVLRVFRMGGEPQQVVVDLRLPAGDERVVGVHLALAGAQHQIAVFDFSEYQLQVSLAIVPEPFL